MTENGKQAASVTGRLRATLESQSVWTTRRDAAEGLMMAARGAILCLREACDDDDRDVSAFCQKALKTLEDDAARTPSELSFDLSSFFAQADDAPVEEDAAFDPAATAQLDRPAVESMARQVAGEMDASIRDTSRGLVIDLALGERSQKVYIEFGRTDQQGREIVLLFTLCGAAEPERYAWALKTNARLTHGALALTTVRDKETLVLVETRLLSAVRRETLASTIRFVAETGDRVEAMLGDEDNH